MDETPQIEPSLKLLVGAASLVVVVSGLRAAQLIFVPFLLAVFLAVLSLPLVGALRRRRVPRLLAVAITLLLDLAALSILGWLASLSLARVSDALPVYQSRFDALAGHAQAWLAARGVRAADWASPASLDVGSIFEMVSGAVKRVAAAVTWVFLVILMMTFVLFEAAGFWAKIRGALGDRREVLERYGKAADEIQRYLRIKTAMSLATGVALGLWVWISGLDFPLLWGFLAFLLNFIPNIGSVIAALPAVLLALLTLDLPRALLVALGYVLVNLVIGNLLEPHLMGRKLRLSPLVVFLALIFWGWVWGPVGMLLSVPITVVLKIVCENSPELGWAADLLDQNPS